MTNPQKPPDFAHMKCQANKLTYIVPLSALALYETNNRHFKKMEKKHGNS